MSVRASGWLLYDAVVERSPSRYLNPWERNSDGVVVYRPDYELLEQLLGVPLALGARSQTGVPALALDVWVAHEFRRAGFEPDSVWPRATAPRVLPAELATLTTTLSGPLRRQFVERVTSGTGLGGVTGASANILGKNYVKQVDVVMSSWQTGPELMVSTKRMDSSFGKNAANRVEESYGDAKNLRLRHPQAALGFVYGLRSTALMLEPEKAEWLIDLLGKLGTEDDAYDAVALIIPEWDETTGAAGDDEDPEDPLVAAGIQEPPPTPPGEDAVLLTDPEVEAQLARLPRVRLNHAHVPARLRPEHFFAVMIRRVLSGCPVNFHREARQRLGNPRVQDGA
jgi:hypothetical protein